MCLDTFHQLESEQKGVGYKLFEYLAEKKRLLTGLNHFEVTRGEWISNPFPHSKLGTRHPYYRSGFHILRKIDEAIPYLAFEYSLAQRPWNLETRQWKIYPVRYRQGHTEGSQYGFDVIVADEIYILTDPEIRTFDATRITSYGTRYVSKPVEHAF